MSREPDRAKCMYCTYSTVRYFSPSFILAFQFYYSSPGLSKSYYLNVITDPKAVTVPDKTRLIDLRQITSFVGHISFYTYEKVPEYGGPGGLFSAPSSPEPNSPSHRFRLFFKDNMVEHGENLQRRLLLTFLDIHSLALLLSPRFSEGRILALRAVPRTGLSLYLPGVLRLVVLRIYI